jgi:hypothetical protein
MENRAKGGMCLNVIMSRGFQTQKSISKSASGRGRDSGSRAAQRERSYSRPSRRAPGRENTKVERTESKENMERIQSEPQVVGFGGQDKGRK